MRITTTVTRGNVTKIVPIEISNTEFINIKKIVDPNSCEVTLTAYLPPSEDAHKASYEFHWSILEVPIGTNYVENLT